MESVQKEKRLLAGVRVVESGNTLASGLAGMLLADLGAEVLRTSPHASQDTKYFLHRGKKYSTVSDMTPSERMAIYSEAAVVIIDEFVFSELAWQPGPRQISCRFTVPQGLRGATPENIDFHAASLAYLFEPVAGFGPPRPFSFPLPSIMAALYGANAIAAALIGVKRFGKGKSIEVSLCDAAVTLLGLKTIVTSGTRTGWSPLQWVSSPFTSVRKTTDGAVYLHIGLSRHLSRFLSLIAGYGLEKYAAKLRSLLDPVALEDPVAAEGVVRAFRVNSLLSKIFKLKTSLEWQSLLGENGLCCLRVGSAEAWRSSIWSRENGMVIDDGVKSPVPGNSIVIAAEGTIEAKTAEAGEGVEPDCQPLAGLMVADFTNIIAGPLAGRTLAEFGATVVRVENPAPYQYFAEPFHLLFNGGKSSVTIDLQSREGREHFKKFISHFRPAMVIQNFRTSVAERLGIGFKELEKELPGLVYLHINAFGIAGPWESYSGFEQTIQATCGIMEAYSAKENPELFPYPVNDMMTGLLGSFGTLAAYYRRLREGTGSAVATSLAHAGTLLGSCITQTPHAAARGFGDVFRAKDARIAVSAENITSVMHFAGCLSVEGADTRTTLAKIFRKKTFAAWQKKAIADSGLHVCISKYPARKSLQEFHRSGGRFPVGHYTFPDFGKLLITGSPVRYAGKEPKHLPCASARGVDTKTLFSKVGVEWNDSGRSIVPLFSKKRGMFAVFDTVKWAIYYLITNRR